MAGGKVDHFTAELLIISFIALALILEVVLHKLEHWVFTKHPQIQIILRNLYRELMVLGLVSFGFIMYIFNRSPPADFKLTFEVAHVFVFLFAIFHTLTVALAVYLSLNLSQRWKKFERMSLAEYRQAREEYRKLSDKRKAKNGFVWKYLGWWISSPKQLYSYLKLHEILGFHENRWQFIYHFKQQADFRFSKFLRKIKFASFIELVNIHPLTWILLILVIALDAIAYKIGILDFDTIFLICHSALSTVAATVLLWKIHRISWKMTKKPEKYYNSVNKFVKPDTPILDESFDSILEANKQNSIGADVKNRLVPNGRTSNETETSDYREHSHTPIYHNMALRTSDNDLRRIRTVKPKEGRSYPRWLLTLFPHLGREVTLAETLFWFGSPRFYLFCVECVLFFVNINLAGSIAILVFWRQEAKQSTESYPSENPTAKLKTAMHAVETEAPGSLESRGLVTAALVVAVFSWLFVLFSVAAIMRKYIFVLNNGNLLPESMTVTTIKTMNLKAAMNAEAKTDESDKSGMIYNTEDDDEEENAEDFRQLRRKMSRFLEGEQEETKGHNSDSEA